MNITTKCMITKENIATRYSRLTEDGKRIGINHYLNASMELKKGLITYKEALEVHNKISEYNTLIMRLMMLMMRNAKKRNPTKPDYKDKMKRLLSYQNIHTVITYAKEIEAVNREEHIEVMKLHNIQDQIIQDDISHSTLTSQIVIYKNMFPINHWIK